MRKALRNFLKIVVFGLVLYCPLSHGSKALYLRDLQLIDWVQELSPGKFKIYGKFNSEYSPRIVPREDLAFRVSSPIQGVYFGWNLIWNIRNQSYDVCYVDRLFENGFAFSFCDQIIQGKLSRQYRQVMVDQIIGSVREVGSLKVGNQAELKLDIDDYKSGDRVKIKALFANKTALIHKTSLESFLMGGPYHDAQSKLVSVEHLLALP